MTIFAMKACSESGEPKKKVIVYIEAKDDERAYEGFGAGRFWSKYPEDTGFFADPVEEVPKNKRVLSATEIIRKEW